jgi:hypothetical protein
MLISLLRRLWNNQPSSSRGNCRRGRRPSSYQPGIDILEDRLVPALAVNGIPNLGAALQPGAGTSPGLQELDAVVPTAGSGLQPISGKAPAAPKPIVVTVSENAPETVIDMGAAFDAMAGIQHKDGLRLRMVGNTNSGLVKSDLSEAALTLAYTRGKCGTATITVAATDADGVSVKATVQVTVSPPTPPVTEVYNPPAPKRIEG